MRTVLVNLPYDCRGCVTETGEGEPCIILNARMNHETNVMSYEHELRHIKSGDLHREKDVNAIESYCHMGD